MWGGDGGKGAEEKGGIEGNCVITALIEIKDENQEKNEDKRDEEKEETKGEGGSGDHTKTPGEPVW